MPLFLCEAFLFVSFLPRNNDLIVSSPQGNQAQPTVKNATLKKIIFQKNCS